MNDLFLTTIMTPVNTMKSIETWTQKQVQSMIHNVRATAQKINIIINKYFDNIKTVALLAGTWYSGIVNPIPFGITAFVSFIFILSDHDSKNLETGEPAIPGKPILENMKDTFSSPVKFVSFITLLALPVLRGAFSGVVAGDYFARSVSDYMSKNTPQRTPLNP